MPALSHSLVLSAGRFDKDHGSTAETFNGFVSQLQAAPPERLVLYFHGGLVDLESGLAGAKALEPKFQETGATPIFVIWQSGWDEIVEKNLPAIFNEGIFKRIRRRVTQAVKGKIDKTTADGAAKAVGGLPLMRDDKIQAELAKAEAGQPLFGDHIPRDIPELTAAEEDHIRRTVQGDVQLQVMAAEIANGRVQSTAATSKGITAQGSTTTLMSPEVLDEIAPVRPGAKSVLSMALLAKHVIFVVAAVISRFRNNRDHGAYLTIVEEILREFYVRNVGKFLWDGMKKEIDQAFDLAPGCGGTALIDGLRGLSANGVKPKITLVGHSAGAIYVARLLSEIEKAKLPPEVKFDVILIAPACTFKVFRQMLQAAGDRIAGLRLFGMGDEREKNNALVPIVYPSSLLYFVSGVIEDEPDMPLLGMQRYYAAPYDVQDFEDLTYVRAFQHLGLQHAYAWADANGHDGANCDMTSHGGWVGAPQTLASVLYAIKKGL
jgi:hypothetical protein